MFSIKNPIEIALDINLDPVWMNLIDKDGGKDVIAVGIPGSGKSNFIHLGAATAALDDNCKLVILDGKKTEMQIWEPFCDYYVGYDVKQAINALQYCDTWVDEKLESLADRGLRLLAPEDETLLLICDEWSTYVNTVDSQLSKQFNALARRFVERKRAVGGVSFFGAQRPASDTTPTFVRDLIGYRAAFYCSTPHMSDIGLGAGMAGAGFSADKLDPAYKGLMYFLGKSPKPILCKTYGLTDEDLYTLASAAVSIRNRKKWATNAHDGNGYEDGYGANASRKLVLSGSDSWSAQPASLRADPIVPNTDKSSGAGDVVPPSF